MVAMMWVAVTGWIPLAYGLDLGGLMVDSSRGEPLRLILSVEAVSAAESESLVVALASRSDHVQAGVKYPLWAEDLQFERVSPGQGKHQVMITVGQPVEGSSVRLLLAATWTGGRVVREYLVLLTPPEPNGQIVLPGSSDRPAFRRPQTPVTPGGEMRVVWGDTLSHIVQRLGLPDELHRFQGYLAILLANPEAFVNHNMNRLRSDVTLKIPTLDEIALVSYSDSVSAYSEQLAQFTAYRNSLRQRLVVDPEPVQDRVPEPEPKTAEQNTPEAMEPKADALSVSDMEQDPLPQPEPKSGEEATDDPVVVEEPPEKRLTIRQEVDSELVTADSGDVQAALERVETGLALLDESLLASDQESGNVLQSLKQLKEQSEDISQLIGIEVEDADLAAMQQRIREKQEEELADNPDTGPLDVSGDLSLSVGATTSKGAMSGESPRSEDTPERDVGRSSGQAILNEVPLSGGRTDPSIAVLDAANERKSASTPRAQPDGPTSSADQVGERQSNGSENNAQSEGSGFSAEASADPMSSPSTGVREAVSDPESEGEALPKPDSDSDEMRLAQHDGPLSPTGTLPAESTGTGGPTETHRGGIQADVLTAIRNVFSTLPEYGQKIAVGLLLLLAGLFFWQRRQTRRTDHQDPS